MSAVERDLLLYAGGARNEGRLSGPWSVHVGVNGCRPLFYFHRQMADAWLADGGRAWILAELEARSGDRVVAFPKRGTPR